MNQKSYCPGPPLACPGTPLYGGLWATLRASKTFFRLKTACRPHFARVPSTTLALWKHVEKFDGRSAGNDKESLAERTAWRRWHGGFQAARAVAAVRLGPAFFPPPAPSQRRCCR